MLRSRNERTVMDFYDTVGGRRFVEGTVPKLVHAIERAAKAMERANRIKERELDMLERALRPGEAVTEKQEEEEPEEKLEDGEGYGSDDGR